MHTFSSLFMGRAASRSSMIWYLLSSLSVETLSRGAGQIVGQKSGSWGGREAASTSSDEWCTGRVRQAFEDGRKYTMVAVKLS